MIFNGFFLIFIRVPIIIIETSMEIVMSRHFTGKQSVGTRKITRPNGDVYVYERTTQYDQKTKKTVTLHNRLLGKIDAKTGELVPTRPKKKKKSDKNL